MAYVRKTRDEYELEGWYKESGAWEYIVTAEDMKDARGLIKCYRENDPRPYRIRKRRVRIGKEVGA